MESSDVAAFLSGDDPAGIAESDCVAYWSFTTSSLIDSIGSYELSAGGSTFDADNPDVGSDETAPTVESASVNAAGNTLTLGLSESVTSGTDGWTGFSLGGVSGETLTYSSGDGTASIMFAISGATVLQSDTVTLDHTQPGDGVQDAAGNLLASFSNMSVTNNSAVLPVDPALVLDHQPLRDTDGVDTVSVDPLEVIVLGGTAGARTIIQQVADYDMDAGVVEITGANFESLNDKFLVALVEDDDRMALHPATVVDRNA